jgi:hypothetical protein
MRGEEIGGPAGGPAAPDPTAQAFAACLQTPAGNEVLRQLRRLFLDRRLAPSARDSELWHLEGQRSVVAYVLAMVARGSGTGS